MGNVGSEILSEFKSDEDIVLGRYHVHKAPRKEARANHELSTKKRLKKAKIEAKKREMLEMLR
jgi:hypothetical protein